MTIDQTDEKSYEAFPVACYLLDVPKEKLLEYAIVHNIFDTVKTYDVDGIRSFLKEVLDSLISEKGILSSKVKRWYGKDEKEVIKVLIEVDDFYLTSLLKFYEEKLNPKMRELMGFNVDYLKLITEEAMKKYHGL